MVNYIELAGDRLGEGSSCFVRAEGDAHNQKPFIAKIMSIKPAEAGSGYDVRVRWYYRPDDPGIPGGRRPFHGERELYFSDHADIIHSATILGRCLVHSLDGYRELSIIRPQDYFSRFSFSVATKAFNPEQVTVYCLCRMPENPDRPLSQCDCCSEWYHAECCSTTVEHIEASSVWHCPRCEQKQRDAAQAAAAAAQVVAAAQQPQAGLGGWLGSILPAAGAGLQPPGGMIQVGMANQQQQQRQQQPPYHQAGGW